MITAVENACIESNQNYNHKQRRHQKWYIFSVFGLLFVFMIIVAALRFSFFFLWLLFLLFFLFLYIV